MSESWTVLINRKGKKWQVKVVFERTFFQLVIHLVHFFLCFALHINELLKLHVITFCMFETKIKGVALQTDDYY